MDGRRKDGPQIRAITKDPLRRTRGPKLEKTNGQSLRYLKTTDHGQTTDVQTDRGDY